MTRREQIEKVCQSAINFRKECSEYSCWARSSWIEGALWADKNPDAIGEMVIIANEANFIQDKLEIAIEALEKITNVMHDFETKYFSQESCVIAAVITMADLGLEKIKK